MILEFKLFHVKQFGCSMKLKQQFIADKILSWPGAVTFTGLEVFVI